MDIHQKALLSKLVAQAQTGPPRPTGMGRSITGDKLTRALTPNLHIPGLPIQNHRFPFVVEVDVATQQMVSEIPHEFIPIQHFPHVLLCN